MVPSTGVHDPQREPWLVTHRTLFGFGTPPRYCRDSSAARLPSSASPRDARRALRRSCVASRSSMIAIHRCSSARDMRAGSSTIVRSPSRYADTVRRRRALRRTSTEPSDSERPETTEPSEAATRAPYRRRATPARHCAHPCVGHCAPMPRHCAHPCVDTVPAACGNRSTHPKSADFFAVHSRDRHPRRWRGGRVRRGGSRAHRYPALSTGTLLRVPTPPTALSTGDRFDHRRSVDGADCCLLTSGRRSPRSGAIRKGKVDGSKPGASHWFRRGDRPQMIGPVDRAVGNPGDHPVDKPVHQHAANMTPRSCGARAARVSVSDVG